MSVNRDFKPAHNWGKHKQRDHLTTLVVIGLIVFALLAGVAINLRDMVVDVDEDAAALALETSPSDAPPQQQYDDNLLPVATPAGTGGASASADDDSPLKFFSFYEELPTRQVMISEYRKPPSKSAKNTLLLPPPPPQTAAKPDAKPEPLVARPPADDRGGYLIQAGAFNQFAQADRVRGRLADLGFKAYVQAGKIGSMRVHRVRIGPIAGAAQARAIRRQLDNKGIPSITISPN